MATLKQARKTTDYFNEESFGYAPAPDAGPAPGQPTPTKQYEAAPEGQWGAVSPFQAKQKPAAQVAGPEPGTGGSQRTGSYSVSRRPTTEVAGEQRTTFEAAGPRPEFTAPEYKKVEYDKRRLASLRQKKAAPFRRETLRALQSAFTRSYGSKPERDMAIRNALNQYGTAYGKIMVQAEQAAEMQYERELADTRQERLFEYQSAMMKAQKDFSSAWEAWSKGGTQVTTTTQRTGPAAGGEGSFRPYISATNITGREQRKYL